MAWTSLLLLAGSVLTAYVVKVAFFFKKPTPLPPGPKAKVLIGNLFDLPKPGEVEYVHWLKHREMFGPLSSITIFGQTLIIINDARIAFELMEKRSSKHSSRPKQVFAGQMLGWEKALGLCPYSNRFRAYRKVIFRSLGTTAAASRYNSLQEVEVGHFLLRMLANPNELIQHIKTEAGAVILKVAYGYTTEPHASDPLVTLAGKAMEDFGKAAVPGVWAVDMAPFLRYLPGWAPGTAFKRTARQWNKTLTDLAERPYAFVKHQMAQGKHDESFLSQLLQSEENNEENTFVAKWSAMSLYSGGADTTVSSMACFFLAMSLFPEVQKLAQKEIDRVIGGGRLPGFPDQKTLPYVEAIVKEILRWHPVAPMGLPHGTTEDDICQGYLIPKGALLLPNIWWFTHDPKVYHEPMIFKPERFLSVDGSVPEPDPGKLAFGFGRRICPGRYLAESSLFLNVAQVLSVFAIEKSGKDSLGPEDEVKFLPGVISHPSPFQVSVVPRSREHEALIRSIEKTHPWQKSDAEILKSMAY